MRRARATSDARRTLREAAVGARVRSARRRCPIPCACAATRPSIFYGWSASSVVCVVSATVLVLPPDVAVERIAVFVVAGGTGSRRYLVGVRHGRRRRGARRSSIPRRRATNGAGCKPSSGLLSAADSVARRPVTRVVLHASISPRAARRRAGAGGATGRYALTRAADGSWSLSYRRCTGSCAASRSRCRAARGAVGFRARVSRDVAARVAVDVCLRTPRRRRRPRSRRIGRAARHAFATVRAGAP